ncbi:MAG: hypothetical protein IJF24_00155 [Clostridia bacterium]|nr:hypothetical protein [Clostridia bacterium]
MKRFALIVLALFLVLSLAACTEKGPDADVLTEEELEEILDDMILGDKVDLDDYTDEEKGQIEDELDKGGFIINDEGVLAPKDPISDEKLDEIVNDAIEKGEIDLNDYDDAQKEQIKDKLEEEGLKPEEDQDEGKNEDKEDNKDEKPTPVVPIPELSDKEIADILAAYGIKEGEVLQDDFKVSIDLSKYPKNQQEQIKDAAALMGLEYKNVDGNESFSMMTIHIDEVKDNEYE